MKRFLSALLLGLFLATGAGATLPSNDGRVQYTSTGGTAYTIDFPIWSSAEIQVYVGTTLQASSAYGVSFTAGVTGGTVTFLSAPTAGATVTIIRATEQARTTDFSTSGPFSMKALNSQLDKLTAQVQDLQERLNRAVTLHPSTANSGLPAVSSGAANRLFGTDSLGGYTDYTAAEFGATSDLADTDVLLGPTTTLNDLFDGGYDITVKPGAVLTQTAPYDPRAYGAIGDGTTDDSAALLATITAALAGTAYEGDGRMNAGQGVVDLKGKTYLISTQLAFPKGAGVRITNGVLKAGSGLGASDYMIKFGTGTATFTGTGTLQIEHSEIAFDHVTFEGMHRNIAGLLYLTQFWNVKISNCNFLHYYGAGLETANTTISTVVYTSHALKVENTYFHEWTINETTHGTIGDGYTDATLRTGTGLKIGNPDNLFVNVEVGFTKYPLDLNYAGQQFTNCHFYGGSIDLQHFTSAGDSYLHTVGFSNCYFDNHTALSVHNPAFGVNFIGCIFYNPGTTARNFMTLVADSAAHAARVQVVGCEFKAPSNGGLSVGSRSKPLALDESAFSFASVGGYLRFNDFWLVDSENFVEARDRRLFSDLQVGTSPGTVTDELMVNDTGQAVSASVNAELGYDAALYLRSAGTAKWALYRQATTNNLVLYNSNAAASVFTVDTTSNLLTQTSGQAWAPQASQSVVAGTAITATAHIVLLTAAAPTTMTATPTIANGVNGQEIILLNIGANAITIQDQGTLGSSNLRLTANTVAIAARQSVRLVYSSDVGDWVQIGALVTTL